MKPALKHTLRLGLTAIILVMLVLFARKVNWHATWAGIRTASVWVIGAATLSTPIGQTSLGNYIFTGLQTQNWVFVLFGCAAAVIFALLIDQLLALIVMGVEQIERAAGGAARRR